MDRAGSVMAREIIVRTGRACLRRRRAGRPLLYHLQSLLGIVAHPRRSPGRCRRTGGRSRGAPSRRDLLLQIALALLLLKVPAARAALFSLNGVVNALTAATQGGHVLRLRLCRRRGRAFRGHERGYAHQLRLPDPAARDRDLGAGGAAVALARPAGDRQRRSPGSCARSWASAARSGSAPRPRSFSA